MIKTTDEWILVGQTAVPCDDLLEWARWFETADRRVFLTKIMGMCYVSTVFLGLDHGFLSHGAPILFESMTFWAGESAEEQDRCCTWLEAEAMHARMIAWVTSPRAVLAYIRRIMQNCIIEAKKDWVKGWRELRGKPAREPSSDPLWENVAASMERLEKLTSEREDWDWETYG